MPDQPPTIEYATPFPRKRRPILLIVFGSALLIGIGLFALLFSVRQARVAVVRTPARVATPVVSPPSVPCRLTIVQRESQALPGTNGSVVAHIGDITHRQTLLTIHDSSNNMLLNTISVRQGDVQTFRVGGAAFDVEVVELKNFLTSDDCAVLAIRSAGAALSEEEKIQRLIEAVERTSGMIFIRNGEEHDAAAAAQHLRRKYRSAKGKAITAQQFIDEIATRSSVSGKAYRVKLPDGREMTSQQWLTLQLGEIDGDAPARTTQPSR